MPLPNVFVVTESRAFRPRLHPALRALRALSALSLGLLAAFAVAHAVSRSAAGVSPADQPAPARPGVESQRATTPPPMARARADAELLLAAAHRFRAVTGAWPRGLEDLRRAGEIESTRRDPWGGRYLFFFDRHDQRLAVCATGRPAAALTAACFW